MPMGNQLSMCACSHVFVSVVILQCPVNVGSVCDGQGVWKRVQVRKSCSLYVCAYVCGGNVRGGGV